MKFGRHRHRYVERKEDRQHTTDFIKFVFVCMDCGAMTTKIINPNKDFEIQI